MDLLHPIRAVVPTLDGPVLEVLARTTQPLSGREVHRLSGTGSASGVRRTLARLARQGLVRAEEHAAGTFYLANRQHLAWSAVESLTGLRRELFDRLREELRSWEPLPLHASVFGSMARGEGDPDSDIDLLLVRPDDVGEDESPWADQVDRLRENVRAWTGNECHAFQTDRQRLTDHKRADDPIVSNWLRDAVVLSGPDLRTVLRNL